MPDTDTRRRQILAAAIVRQRGEWTKRRVMRLYQQAGHPAPLTRTARRDLAHAHRHGLLDIHEMPGRRYYTRKDDAR